MPAGIQIFNADGSLQFDIGSRAFRVVTVADIGAVQSGVVPVDLSVGTVVVATTIAPNARQPTLTTTSSGVSWNYGSVPSGERDSNFKIEVALY